MQDIMEQGLWRPLEEMTDREILVEMATNMRATHDMFTVFSSAIQSGGLAGLFKLAKGNGKG